jgi:prepilin-type N-terminal cleavage/methylation domain-containing protein
MKALKTHRRHLHRWYSYWTLRLARASHRLVAGQGGFSMVEIIISIAILSTTSVALVGAMSTGYLGYRTAERDMTALRLAMHQLEHVKCCEDFRPTGSDYPPFPGFPPEYEIVTQSSPILDREPLTLQRVTVTVSYEGTTMITISDYKADR